MISQAVGGFIAHLRTGRYVDRGLDSILFT
jgi:hypothetical protein